MFPFVKVLANRSASELTLEVNQYLNHLQSRNEQDGTKYRVHNMVYKVTALPDNWCMFSVLIVVADDSIYNSSATAMVNAEFPEGLPF